MGRKIKVKNPAVVKIKDISKKLEKVSHDVFASALGAESMDDEISDMEEFKKKHRIKKEVIEQLQELWKDEPPAEEIIKML